MPQLSLSLSPFSALFVSEGSQQFDIKPVIRNINHTKASSRLFNTFYIIIVILHTYIILHLKTGIHNPMRFNNKATTSLFLGFKAITIPATCCCSWRHFRCQNFTGPAAPRPRHAPEVTHHVGAAVAQWDPEGQVVTTWQGENDEKKKKRWWSKKLILVNRIVPIV